MGGVIHDTCVICNTYSTLGCQCAGVYSEKAKEKEEIIWEWFGSVERVRVVIKYTPYTHIHDINKDPGFQKIKNMYYLKFDIYGLSINVYC